MKVVLGSNIAGIEVEDNIYSVKRVIPHPYYYDGVRPTKFSFISPSTCPVKDDSEDNNELVLFNDIAVLELERDIKFGPNIKALEIAPKGFVALQHADNAVVVGWGRNLYTGDATKYLQNFNFRIQPDGACVVQGYYKNYIGFEDSIICLGGLDMTVQVAGPGDSGGPAICRGPTGRAVLCGVASIAGNLWLSMIRKIYYPNVYTEVAHYHDWIEENAGQQESETLYQPYLFGENLPFSQRQHQVRITSDNGKPCGGTLIAPGFVVTVAQCVLDLSSGTLSTNLLVTAGQNELKDKGQSFPIQDVLFQHNGQFISSIAVIKLFARLATLTTLPKLPTRNFFSDKGRAMAFPVNSTYSSMIRQREFRLLRQEECQQRMERRMRGSVTMEFWEETLCGVEKYAGQSTCDGELGGGIICEDENGQEVLCGIQFFEYCEFSIPKLFLNMAYYVDWLREEMTKRLLSEMDLEYHFNHFK